MILLDTSVLIDLDGLSLPTDDQWCISAISWAELSFGVSVAPDPVVRAQRQARLHQIDALGMEWLPFDQAAGLGYAQAAAQVWKTRRAHARSKDVMLAGQAIAAGARLATLNYDDFALLEGLLGIVVPTHLTPPDKPTPPIEKPNDQSD